MENKSDKHQLTAFLCGQFTTLRDLQSAQSLLLQSGWSRESHEMGERYSDQYVPDFIDY